MLANLLVEYCSPTLAGIKTANLFNCQYGSHSRAELAFIIALWNRRLNSKGVSLKVLRFSRGNALIYVYREKQLKEDFKKNGVAEFLFSYGYDITNIQACIERLSKRICESESFPHEIGLEMLQGLLKTKEKIVYTLAFGRFIATKMKHSKSLKNIKNAERFIRSYITEENLLCS